MRMRVLRLIALACAMLFATAVQAQYPSRPIKIVVPSAPGGAPDLQTRIIGARLAELLGQPVVAENRPGSNGNIGGDVVAKAAPDGYTLLLGADSLIAINPHLYARMAFDSLKDVVPV